MRLGLHVYSDGASRGNPGPSAAAFMLVDQDGRVLKEGSKYVGFRTNNQAEYMALLLALQSASRMTENEVVCYMDSELVVKQLNREYQVRNSKLKTLWLEVQELEQMFEKVSFFQVARTNRFIQRVDRLANEALAKIHGR